MSHAPISVPRPHVACFDTTTGQDALAAVHLCRGNARPHNPGRIVHSNLLTFAGGTIYVNTNLGTVAASKHEKAFSAGSTG